MSTSFLLSSPNSIRFWSPAQVPSSLCLPTPLQYSDCSSFSMPIIQPHLLLPSSCLGGMSLISFFFQKPFESPHIAFASFPLMKKVVDILRYGILLFTIGDCWRAGYHVRLPRRVRNLCHRYHISLVRKEKQYRQLWPARRDQLGFGLLLLNIQHHKISWDYEESRQRPDLLHSHLNRDKTVNTVQTPKMITFPYPGYCEWWLLLHQWYQS